MPIHDDRPPRMTPAQRAEFAAAYREYQNPELDELDYFTPASRIIAATDAPPPKCPACVNVPPLLEDEMPVDLEAPVGEPVIITFRACGHKFLL